MNPQPASAPQQPQPPQQHLQLSGKRYHFLESIPPYCGGCVTAEKIMKPEVACGKSTGKPLRVPYLTPGGTLVIPFDSPERYHWWRGGQSVEQTRAEVLTRMAVERAQHGRETVGKE